MQGVGEKMLLKKINDNYSYHNYSQLQVSWANWQLSAEAAPLFSLWSLISPHQSGFAPMAKSDKYKKQSSVQSLSHVRLFATPWTAARQASLSITNSQSLLKLMSIKSVMPSSHLILCCPLLLPSIFPSIRVFFQ